jgi:hypothetical protein
MERDTEIGLGRDHFGIPRRPRDVA